MSATLISIVILLCMLGGIGIGRALRAALPQHHLSEDSKNTVTIATGLIATLTVLVLGLLVSSASGSFNAEKDELDQVAASIILLDRMLAQYGADAAEARNYLRAGLETRLRMQWSKESDIREPTAAGVASGVEKLQAALFALAPRTDVQKARLTSALDIAQSLAHTRWLLEVQQEDVRIPMAFIVVLAVWTGAIFTSFSLFAPSNATTTTALLVCVLSVTGAVFLILELSDPYGGLIKLSPLPLEIALEHLGRP